MPAQKLPRLPRAVSASITGAVSNLGHERNRLVFRSLFAGVCEMTACLAEHGFVEDLQSAINALNLVIENEDLVHHVGRFQYRVDNALASGTATPREDNPTQILPKAASDALVEGLQYYADRDKFEPYVIAERLRGSAEVIAQLAEHGFANDLQPVLDQLAKTLKVWGWGWNQSYCELERRVQAAGGPVFLEAARA